MITRNQIDETTSIKDFMEWFVSEYDGYWLPEDFNRTLNRLEGYEIKIPEGTLEKSIINSTIQLLRDNQNLLRTIKYFSHWEYKGK